MTSTPDETGMDDDMEPVVICPRTKQPCMPNSGGWSCEDMGCWLIYGEDDDL
jgi:hypothetical protein